MQHGQRLWSLLTLLTCKSSLGSESEDLHVTLPAEQERFVVKPFSMRGGIAAEKAVTYNITDAQPFTTSEYFAKNRTSLQAEQERFVVKPFSMRGGIAAVKAAASRANSLAAPAGSVGHLVAPAVRYPS